MPFIGHSCNVLCPLKTLSPNNVLIYNIRCTVPVVLNWGLGPYTPGSGHSCNACVYAFALSCKLKVQENLYFHSMAIWKLQILDKLAAQNNSDI